MRAQLVNATGRAAMLEDRHSSEASSLRASKEDLQVVSQQLEDDLAAIDGLQEALEKSKRTARERESHLGGELATIRAERDSLVGSRDSIKSECEGYVLLLMLLLLRLPPLPPPP